MLRRVGAVVLVASLHLLASTSVAHADPPEPGPNPAAVEAAANAKARGDDLLVGGRHAEALAAYQESYALKKDPAVLYNIGRAHQGLGAFPDALDALEEFASTAPPSILARVPGLPNLLAEVRAKVATVAISVDVPGATVKLGSRVVGTTPLAKPLRTGTGQFQLVVEKEGYFPYSKSHAFAAGVSTLDIMLHSKAKEAIVSVTSPIIGAKLRIDGRDQGTVPTEVALSPGSHRLDLERDGYKPAQTSIALLAGERTSVDVPMQKTAPITAKWWFWTGIGVVVLGAVATTIVLTTERDADRGNIAPGQITTGLRF
ncbi:MAG: PEGA domain-containing protein [Deltaproteobacteria bacterium]|nr:PEGA domain-containing protein [Deltaproteobacteria bacterium]